MGNMKTSVMETRYFAVATLLIATLFNFIRLLPTLPTVMQDEYIYLSQAILRPLGENDFGNFLFSFIYSVVIFLGEEFYIGVKIINACFLFLFGLFIFLTSRLFLQNGPSLVLALSSILSATSLYASVFMPEIMYFSLASGSLYFMTLAFQDSKSRQLAWAALSVIFLAFASLTKPHALILAVGYVLFVSLLLMLGRVRAKSGVGLISIFLLGFPALKLGLGFLLAGKSGLTMLGKNYEQSLYDFLSRFSLGSGESLSAAGGAVAIGNEVGLSSFILLFLMQLAPLAFGLLFATLGLPLLLLRTGRKLSDYQWLVLIVSGTYIVAISAFGALVTSIGDDHSNRVLLRYLEFLVPFLLLAVLMEVAGKKTSSNVRFGLLFTAFSGASIYWVVSLSAKQHQLSDSAILLGGFRLEILPWLVIAGWIGVLILVIDKPKFLLTGVVTAIFLVSSIIGYSSQERQLILNSEKFGPDFAGESLRANFTEVADSEILVVGTNLQFVSLTKFWSLRADVDHLILNQGSELDIESDLLNEYSVVVELPGVKVSGGILLDSGRQYRILKNPTF